ncbi:MAG: ribonuclease Y [Chloroflexi bacterium]|nr:MAG: ribonuclease Y [Chloroflexota bacterium]RLC90697.1 MAG: ribonuclease Y [Chloroflexota bacterium]HEY67252.1 ribonuclease Y [Thermoflexia bacterium]
MNEWGIIIIVAVLALAVGFWLGFLIRRYTVQAQIKKQQQRARQLLEKADKKAKEIVLAAKDEALQIRNAAEKALERRRAGLRREEERLQRRREKLDQRQEQLEQRQQALNKRQSALDKQRNQIERLRQEQMAMLERVAGLSREEAKQELLKAVEEEARQDMARVIRRVEAEAKEEAEARARKIITLAIQRMASEQVAELTVSTVPLPSDDMKGRIIGRSGRNIRSFERAAGVDVVVDDTPEAVTISCFDPVRREVARRAMERLVLDGRIHPARIEKVIADSRKEVERIIREEGERAAYEAGVPGLHPEIIKLLGRLKFRTSYGQNQHAHAIETAKLAGMMAEELGANAEIARAGGLLHDIGKAVDFETEGTHVRIGVEICRRYGVSEEVIHCIEAHHHEVEPHSVEAIIVEAADAISGARPGARRESLELYLKRIHALEEIAKSFKGVAECYAIQAGREIRIIVKPDEIDDLATIRLSKNIASKLEESLEYPGQIKVTVIREIRAEEYAK